MAPPEWFTAAAYQGVAPSARRPLTLAFSSAHLQRLLLLARLGRADHRWICPFIGVKQSCRLRTKWTRMTPSRHKPGGNPAMQQSPATPGVLSFGAAAQARVQ
jgi:hypothetical protein